MWATAGLGWTAPVRGGGFGGRPEGGGGGGGGVARSYGGLAAAGGRLETYSSLGLGAEAAGGPSVGGAQLGVHSVSCLTWLKLPTTFSPYTQQGDGTPRRYPLHPSVAQPATVSYSHVTTAQDTSMHAHSTGCGLEQCATHPHACRPAAPCSDAQCPSSVACSLRALTRFLVRPSSGKARS